jgi:hypothetical protein
MPGRGARFWWDRINSHERSANGDPELVASGLIGDFDGKATDDFWHTVINRDKRHNGLTIPHDYAFFMRGTTAELIDVMSNSAVRGELFAFILHGPMLVRYFRTRHKDPFKVVYTETTIGISGYSYWGEDSRREGPAPRTGWRTLTWSLPERYHVGQKAPDFMLITFAWLAHKGLPACKQGRELGKSTWRAEDVKLFPSLPDLPNLAPLPVFPDLPATP